MTANIVYLLILLTAVGFFIKSVALVESIKNYRRKSFLSKLDWLILILMLQSFGEFYFYILAPDFWLSDYLLRFYYATSFITAFLGPVVVAEINNSRQPSILDKISKPLVLSLILLVLCSDLIIAGTTHTGISLTRIAGPLYWLFQLIILTSITLTFYILVNACYTKDGLTKVKAESLTLSFVPYALFIVLIIALMAFFKGINAIGILPILMSLFMLALVKYSTGEKIHDLTYWVPFSKRRKLINQLARPFISVCEEGIEVDIKKEYDSIVAQHALQLFNGNQTKAANWLHTSQSWVSRNHK